MTKIVYLLIIVFICGCATNDKVWYRGNTHTHTELCGHADSHPDKVAKWYLDQGYNFLILSEHNIFIDPNIVKLPENRRQDFILVPGQEVTGHKHIHTTAMNIKERVPANYFNNEKEKIVQHHVDSVIGKGGHAILNHPNFHYALDHHHIGKVKNLYMFELFNGHPTVNNHGDKDHESTEQMWDRLLSAGMLIYGVSSDDAHHFKKWAEKSSNPGRGWVMVNSNGDLSSSALTHAMVHGHFYSSSGVFLNDISKNKNHYSVSVNDQLTKSEINKAFVSGKIVKNAQEGYLIEFIADEGKVLKSANAMDATFSPPKGISYLRVKVTLTLKLNGEFRQFFAWGQPVFFDDRSH